MQISLVNKTFQLFSLVKNFSMKLLVFLVLVAVALSQFAVIELYSNRGCSDRRIWGSARLGQCISMGGRSGKIECDGSNVQAFDCASSDCTSCQQVQSRPTGCMEENGVFAKLSCGAEPSTSPREIVSKLSQGGQCRGDHLAKIVYPGGCVAGPSFSSRAQCSGNFYRYEQFSTQDCSGNPSSRFAWPAGCSRIPLPGADLSVELPTCENHINLVK